MQMQKLGKPRHSHVLSPLKRLLLLRIARIASNSEPMRRARKILIVVFEVQARNHAVGVLSQLGRPLRIVLRGDDLDGHGDGVDVLLCCERRVRAGDAVDEVFALIGPRVSHVSVQHSVGLIFGRDQWCCTYIHTFGSELERGPSAPAEADYAKLLETMFLLQGFDAGFNFGKSKFLGVTTDECREVEFATSQYLRSDDFASKTSKIDT